MVEDKDAELVKLREYVNQLEAEKEKLTRIDTKNESLKAQNDDLAYQNE